MKCETVVTFEFNVKHPITVRSEFEATNPRAIASRAIKQAQSQNKGIKWSSMVCLLIRKDIEDGTE